MGTLKKLPADQVLAAGRKVLATEGNALLSFSTALDDSFVKAVEIILQARGRVILSGMGKSGHVAKKIAATLASTGTPAQFVHPAEASHGDLGMVTKDDVAIVLSNSGETAELSDIVAHTRRFKIPLIGVASKPESSLLTAADVALVLPPAPEACAIGMAPTTSTTMTMALGDALAVALMECRDFQPENFRVFHPGGSLGAQLLKVSNLMHVGEALPVCPATTPMTEALVTMSAKGFGTLGIVDDGGAMLGIITDGDLRRNMGTLLEKTAGEVCTRNPKTIAATALASEALGTMSEKAITSLFVVDEAKKVIGFINIHDCLRAGVK